MNASSISVNERTAVFGGYATRYFEAGVNEEPTILLIHDGAWGGAADVTWEHIVPQLAESFHVLAPDMLGFGATDKVVYFDRAPYEPRVHHLQAFLTDLIGERPVHLVGSSFGASVALRWLADRASPTRIASVTALQGTGGPWRTAVSIEGLRDWDGTEADMRRIVALLVNESSEFERQVELRMQWAREVGHYRSLASTGMRMPDPLRVGRPAETWPEDLRGTRAPLLLVAGARDPLLEVGWIDHIRDARTDAEVNVGEFSHLPSVDAPVATAELIADFVARASKNA